MQTRRQSVIETAANYISGFAIAWGMNRYLLPLYGFHVNNSSATSLTVIFTVVSVLRSYICRRIFNHLHRPRKRQPLILNEVEFFKR